MFGYAFATREGCLTRIAAPGVNFIEIYHYSLIQARYSKSDED